MSHDAIDRWISSGRVVPVHRGVFALGHAHLTLRGRWMAAVLACGPDAVLSHRDAAALWGIRPSNRRAIDINVAKWRKGPEAIHVHTSPVADDERTLRAGIPVTTPFRTLLDLAGVLTERDLRNAANEAERQKLGGNPSLTELFARHERRPGTAKLRMIQPSTRLTRSALERAFLEYCTKHDIPLPQTNTTIAGYEVDAVWIHPRLIAELDGYEYHRTHRAFTDDRTKDQDLQAAGWPVIRIADEHLHTPRLARRVTALLSRGP